MKLLRSIGTMAAVFVLAFSISLYSFKAARGSDHQDSPTVVANPLADITDVFAFPNPHDASRVALAMDVRPLIPTGMTAASRSIRTSSISSSSRTSGVASNSFNENTVIQFTADSTGTAQKITLYGPATPNEVGTSNTTVGQDGHVCSSAKSRGSRAASRSSSDRGATRSSSISPSSSRSFRIATIRITRILPPRNRDARSDSRRRRRRSSSTVRATERPAPTAA